MTIDTYSWPGISADKRGWGSGWPDCQTDKWVPAPTPIFGKVHQAVEEMLGLLLAETERRGYHLKGDGLTAGTSQCWGADCRPIKAPSGGLSDIPSNHSWGLAVDLNSIDNHYGGTTHDIPDSIAALWNTYGWRWGGSWSADTKDWMHFDFMGTPVEAAAMTALAREQLTQGGFLVALSDAEQTEILNKVRRTQQFVKGIRQSAKADADIEAADKADENYMAGRKLALDAQTAAGK